jgi:hypothetical protein
LGYAEAMGTLWFLLFSVLASAQVRVCVLEPVSGGKLLQLVKNETKTCKACRVTGKALSNGSRERPAKVASAISGTKGNCEIVLLAWNRVFSPDWMPVIEALREGAKDGRIMIAAGGVTSGKSERLSKTLLGRVEQDVFIIGELNAKGRLGANSYSAPGYFTALRPPKGFSGSGTSAAVFAAVLARNYLDRSPDLWRIRLSNNKAASAREWPTLAELFEDKSLGH